MHTRTLPISVRLAVLAATVIALTACAHGRDDRYYAPAPYPAPGMAYHDYWYYPAIGCYYDTHAHVYIYYERDHWVRARALPPHLRPHLGRHVTVRSPHDRPYEDHDRHRQQYAPERYRDAAPGGGRPDVWLGPPRREPAPRDRDERRRDERDRNGRPAAGGYGDDRRPGGAPVPHDHREQRQDGQRAPAARDPQAPDLGRPPATAAPAKQPHEAGTRENRRERPQEPNRNANGRPHDDGRRAAPPVQGKPRPAPDGTPDER